MTLRVDVFLQDLMPQIKLERDLGTSFGMRLIRRDVLQYMSTEPMTLDARHANRNYGELMLW